MTYQWTNPATTTYQEPIIFSISNGVVGIDCTAVNSGEGMNPTQFATLMGQIKDALEDAGLTVGTIYLSLAGAAVLQDV